MAWWHLTVRGKEELTDVDKEHIAQLIKEGYTEGKLDDEEDEENDCACDYKPEHNCFCSVSDDREIGIECGNYKDCECPCHSGKEKEVGS